MDQHVTAAASVGFAGFIYSADVLRRPAWMPRWLARFKGSQRFWTVVDHDVVHNLLPIEGINHLLAVGIGAATQVTVWQVGIFEANYTPLATDTMAAFPAAATESVAYAEAVRQAYIESVPAAGALTNAASLAQFTMNASKTIYGAFLSSSAVKGGVTGVLLSAAKFAAGKVVDNGDILRVTVGVSITS